MSKYPSEEQIQLWLGEYFAAPLRKRQELFIARKACDWQREKDAKICETVKSGPFYFPPDNHESAVANAYEGGAAKCAALIREGAKP